MDFKLNLPPAPIRLKKLEIWDSLRKKWLKNTPEEWVRQHFIHYLVDHLNYPQGRMVSEYLVKYNHQNKRCDIAVFDEFKNPLVIVECKAPHIKLTEDTFFQIAKYTHVLKAPVLILTNGMEHYCAILDRKTGQMRYLPQIPKHQELLNQLN